MTKTALITGVTGQDGYYLTQLLLSKGYQVIGGVRRKSNHCYGAIQQFASHERFKTVYLDVTDAHSLNRVLEQHPINEVYNLAGLSFVPMSWEQPEAYQHVNFLGVVRLLEAIRMHQPQAKFFQASTSEMYGDWDVVPRTEMHRFYPKSPYAVSKVAAHHMVINYRESYDMFACCGIMFNHESPMRSLDFVTRKIVRGAVSIYKGDSQELVLGNMQARRDWSFAGDSMQAAWLMLQQDKADDFVIASGEAHSVADFCQLVFDQLQMDYRYYVKVSEQFQRPCDVEALIGDASRIRDQLGWYPSLNLKQLVQLMVQEELNGYQHPERYAQPMELPV